VHSSQFSPDIVLAWFQEEKSTLWRLKEIAAHDQLSISTLVEKIDSNRGETGNLSSAIRPFVLDHYRQQAAFGSPHRSRMKSKNPTDEAMTLGNMRELGGCNDHWPIGLRVWRTCFCQTDTGHPRCW
jgi:predicted DNA-binding ribbon-helix-helix protein